MTVAPLGPSDAGAVRALLQTDPLLVLGLLDELDQSGLDCRGSDTRWYGSWVGGRLRALSRRRVDTAWIFGAPAACTALGGIHHTHDGLREIMGSAAAVDAAWPAFSEAPPRRRLEWVQLVCNQPVHGPWLPVRQATMADLSFAGLAMTRLPRETHGESPNPMAMMWDAQALIAQQRLLIGDVDGVPACFFSHGRLRPEGMDITGFYILPQYRQRGLARKWGRGFLRYAYTHTQTTVLTCMANNQIALSVYQTDDHFRLRARIVMLQR